MATNRTHWRRRAGYTLIEVAVTIGIILMFAGLVTAISVRAMNRGQANSEIEMVLAALSTQQQRAANRVINEESRQDYGVYFFTNGYTLFSGSTYQADKPENQTVTLPPGVYFSAINVPSTQVVFQEATGFVKNFEASRSGVVLTDQAGRQAVVTINRLGIVEVAK